MPTVQTNGARIAYTGHGHGPAVLLVQGAGVGGEGWRPQVSALSNRYQLVTFDNRGIGASVEDRRTPLAIEGMADDAIAVADATGLERFHVVGHSLGGLIAQEIALRAPDRVESLAFLCSFSRGAQAAALSFAMLVAALRIHLGTRAMRRRAFLELIMPHAYLATVDTEALAVSLAGLFGHDLADQPPIALRQVRAAARFDRTARLGELRIHRTLVVGAAEDRIARPAYGRALAAAIPGARHVEIPAAGHAVTIQRAADVNALLDAHWAPRA